MKDELGLSGKQVRQKLSQLHNADGALFFRKIRDIMVGMPVPVDEEMENLQGNVVITFAPRESVAKKKLMVMEALGSEKVPFAQRKVKTYNNLFPAKAALTKPPLTVDAIIIKKQDFMDCCDRIGETGDESVDGWRKRTVSALSKDRLLVKLSDRLKPGFKSHTALR